MSGLEPQGYEYLSKFQYQANEFVRTCPYCAEEFIADHMTRKFCPEKYGIEDWCKNKYKRVANAMTKQVQEEPPPEVIKPPPVIEPIVEAKPIAPVVINVTPQVTNLSLLVATISGFQHLKLHIKYLPNIGFIYEANDQLYQMPGTELFVRTYGPYAIAWGYPNHIILTYKKNIPWIQ